MITQISFDSMDASERGLATEVLRNLGPLVVLAGPNGGGKTRHLELVLHTLQQSSDARSRLEPSGISPELRVAPHFKDLSEEHWVRSVADRVHDTTGGRWLHGVLIRYRPDPSPMDPHEIPPSRADKQLREITRGSHEAIAPGLHLYLERMARALKHHVTSSAKADSEHQFAVKFNELIKELLGTTVEPRIDATGRVVPTLFGKPFRKRELSEGQCVLLWWAILILRQRSHYKGKIVLLDEPEVYLHPDACVRAIGALQQLLGDSGQIWLATHSLPLIAWAGAESLHFVENGMASYAGTTPSRVWQTLLGGQEVRESLLQLLDGDAAAAIARFASECLTQPGVASAGSSDPQSTQYTTLVTERLRSGTVVRVLEIGAGRGRLVAAMTDSLRKDPSLQAACLIYVAYEDKRFIVDRNRASCEQHLAELCGLGANTQYTTDLADLQARDTDGADLVVLANTLHEIPVEDWLVLFEDIRRASRPGAMLLVIEDQEPRIGEMPHSRGFLILEKSEWRALTQSDDAEISSQVVDYNGRRLTAFKIPVAKLACASAGMVRALEMVAERALREIRNLRDRPVDLRAGRRHAFLAMLHVNATLARQVFLAR